MPGQHQGFDGHAVSGFVSRFSDHRKFTPTQSPGSLIN